MKEIGRRGRVVFVNVSKATNADSAAQALACFDDIFWIAGGKAKTGGISSLGKFFPHMRKAYLIGEAAKPFAAELEGRVPNVIAGTLDHAIELAAKDAEASASEPVVLLSPACGSFDQFRNFEVHGDEFRELVVRIPGMTRATDEKAAIELAAKEYKIADVLRDRLSRDVTSDDLRPGPATACKTGPDMLAGLWNGGSARFTPA
jgi:hypothetical protein